MRLIARRFGQVTPIIKAELNQLSVQHLEDLGEALPDFSEVSELEEWLRSHG